MKLITSLVIATGLPLAGAGIANAVQNPSITSCSVSPATVSLYPGQSTTETIGWGDGVNTPGSLNDVSYQEMSINGSVLGGSFTSMSSYPSNPGTVSFTYDQLSGALQGVAGTAKISFFATDGSVKVGSELCSFAASVAAVGSTPPTTVVPTTVVPTTLPHTGSNTGTLLAGGAMVLAFGGALYVSGRRRSIK
jgi:LPXTG-motif cell wall-anchored protein